MGKFGERGGKARTHVDGSTSTSNAAHSPKGPGTGPDGATADARESRQAPMAGEAVFHELFENNPQPMWVCDLETLRFIEVNKAALLRYGYDREGFLSLRIGDILPKDDREALTEGEEQPAPAGRRSGASTHLAKDGTPFLVELSSHTFVLGGRRAALVVVLDVTRRRMAEARLSTQYSVARALADPPTLEEGASRALRVVCQQHGFDVGLLWRVDWEGGALRCAGSYHGEDRVLEVFVEQCKGYLFAPGDGFPGMVWAESHQEWWNDLTRLARFPRMVHAASAGLQTVIAAPAPGQRGTCGVLELFAIVPKRRDEDIMNLITALAQQFGQYVERQHLEREGLLLSAAVEQANESILITDVDGVIQYANAAFERLTGYSRNEAIGRNPRMLKSGKHPPGFYTKLWDAIKAGKVWSGQIINRRKDGQEYVQHLVISPVQFASGTTIAYVGSARDISAELEMEKRLQQAKSMETIGLITAGVAHEVRNPLFAISALAKGLEAKLADRHECSDFTTKIQDQVKGLNELMADLLVLGRPADPTGFLPVDLRDVVADAVRTLTMSDVSLLDRCIVDFREENLRLVGDRSRLTQVFVNLLHNAATLSGPGEKITVRCHPGKRLLRIEVTDSGPGIPDDLMPKLFEPFQSRRKGGTGLGLAIVKKIVAVHGGTIRARNNEPPPGATFVVEFPSIAL